MNPARRHAAGDSGGGQKRRHREAKRGGDKDTYRIIPSEYMSTLASNFVRSSLSISGATSLSGKERVGSGGSTGKKKRDRTNS